MAKLEEDIASEWQEKCTKLLRSAEEKHARTAREVEDEKEAMQQKVNELESKVGGVRNVYIRIPVCEVYYLIWMFKLQIQNTSMVI